MKFDQDLEGLLWTGNEQIGTPGPFMGLMDPGSSRLTYTDWLEYWAARNARLATMPELYRAMKLGIVAQPENSAIEWTCTGTTTQLTIDQNGVLIIHDVSKNNGARTTMSKGFYPPPPAISPLFDFLNKHRAMSEYLISEHDGSQVVLDYWSEYFRPKPVIVVNLIQPNTKYAVCFGISGQDEGLISMSGIDIEKSSMTSKSYGVPM